MMEHSSLLTTLSNLVGRCTENVHVHKFKTIKSLNELLCLSLCCIISGVSVCSTRATLYDKNMEEMQKLKYLFLLVSFLDKSLCIASEGYFRKAGVSVVSFHEHKTKFTYSNNSIHVVELIKLANLTKVNISSERQALCVSEVQTLNMITVSKLSAFIVHHCFSPGDWLLRNSTGTCPNHEQTTHLTHKGN